ncbi:MAG: hypothetical protein ACYCSB_01220 [bacterium]|jgi:hypothetical protein
MSSIDRNPLPLGMGRLKTFYGLSSESIELEAKKQIENLEEDTLEEEILEDENQEMVDMPEEDYNDDWR